MAIAKGRNDLQASIEDYAKMLDTLACDIENVYKCAKNIRKMKWCPIIRILLYLRDIESKEKNYEESIK